MSGGWLSCFRRRRILFVDNAAARVGCRFRRRLRQALERFPFALAHADRSSLWHCHVVW
jgi:hypothetical protein